MKRKLVHLALILFLVSVSCSLLPNAVTETPPAPRAAAQLIVSADPNSTATPTPFQPVGPTLTPLPSATPVFTDTPEPPPPPAEPTSFVVRQSQAEGTVNILLMGSDFRPNSGFRTDVMLLVSIHSKEGTISALSFPRDLYVTIPGWMEQRLNTAFPHGGFPLMVETLQYNFGVRPDYYILTNFQGFTGIINNLGGITVNIERELTDKCDLPQQVNTYCTVYPGPMQMDGATALWYVRSRHSSSDFDRTRRAQEVILGVFKKLMSLNAVSRMPELFATYQQNVETNLTVDTIAPLLPVATLAFSDPSRIRRYAIGPGQVYPYVTAGGAQVLLPNYEAINQIVKEAVYSP